MMQHWQEFTESQSAKTEPGNFICDASELGLILVNGDDAESFLQNQLSNDISYIDETRFQLSSYSTAKGRMLAILQVVRISNGFILITPISMVETLLQRLQMFVIQAKVSLANASGHFTRFALQTDKNAIIDHPHLPKQEGQVIQNDSLISLQLSSLDQQKRYLLLCLSLDEAKSIWDEFKQHLQVGNFDAWRLSQIKSGMPTIYPQTSEEFVLQMANLDLLEGVSFQKGCYPGQEIIARMHYLGKLKRRLFLTSFKTDKCPLPGDEIIARGAESPDGSGKVVDAVIDDEGTCYCLYIAQIKKATNDELCLYDQSLVAIASMHMPYTVPEVQK
jgi:folate-binding protein YgfZ